MKKIALCFLVVFINHFVVRAEDGHRLWLRYDKSAQGVHLFSSLIADDNVLAVSELQDAWKQITGNSLPKAKKLADNVLVVGTSKNKTIQSLGLQKTLNPLGSEGYVLKTITDRDRKYTVVAGNSDSGLLYGIFYLLRLIQTSQSVENLNIIEKPAYKLRLLNHWDNLDRTVERGYAGYSIWRWDELPGIISPLYRQYARANASVGINGTVLNNVNASPLILSAEYLEKVKVIAAELRPYNIRVYLSINFSSPRELGGLKDSDPLNPEVQKWWNDKAKEIYSKIPDFGGFLVKANSEGLPGPMDYGRTHADGANMLADALKPFGGIVMWRAFVYNPDGDDRAKQAFKEFKPFDGKFRDNVIIQVKNGPVDFQPREPFSPLFGAMEQTPVMPEFQITQEYLGFSNHVAYLAPMWKECLDSDTYCKGKGSSVAKTTDGSLFNQKITAIAGVANIGENANWCGNHFAQANWYAFGRLAWNHQLSSEKIAEEWLKMTFTSDTNFIEPVKKLMLTSRESVVKYMMPMGLHHLFAWGHHYGPEPWCEVPGARPDWLPKYYHNAGETGIGFDRTTSGSNAVSQYYSPLREQFNNIGTCPENLLLWFHHLPWNYKMKNGKILWDELCYRYDEGVHEVREYQKTWDKMEHFIDAERFRHVQTRLKIQAKDAVWWKDACLLYFQQFSKMPIPYNIERPLWELDDLMKIKLNMTHHN